MSALTTGALGRAQKDGLMTKRSGWVVTTLSLVMVASAPLHVATAAPPDAGWTGSGTAISGTVMNTTVVNDGSTGPATFAYDNLAPAQGGGGANATAQFTTTTSTTKNVDLSYVFTGFHAFFQVRVQLEAFVSNDDGTITIPLVNAGPVDCCTAPSAGFSYTGDVSLSLAAGDTYGFRIAGSNGDLNARLSGRLIVDSLGGLGPTVKVVNGYSQTRTEGGSGLIAPAFATTRALLTDPSSFGGGGATFGTDLVLGAGVDTVSVTSLLGTDIFVTGSVASSTYTPDELQALEDFVARGGTLIATTNDPSHSMVETFGLEQFSGVTGSSTFVSPLHEIADGPFGAITGFEPAASSGFVTGVGGTATAVAVDTIGNVTMAEIRSEVLGQGSGVFLFVGDVEVLGSGAADNVTLIENLFAYAAGHRAVTPPPAPGEVVLLQAVPAGAQTAVTLRASGTPGGTTAVELVTASTCLDGVLGTPTTFAEIAVTFDGDGEAFFSDLVTNQAAPDTFVAARFGAGGAIGNCVVAGPDNDTWTRALTIPLTASGEVQSGAVAGRLDSAGNSRWYRFAIQPGAEVAVDLSNLPADYDLALFTDIGQAFDELVGNADVDGLDRLSAEYAPAVFSPAVFSPAVFSPAVFSPDAYAPAVFSPAVFSPAVFSPAVFSPAVFSPAVFSPAVFSPAVFSPAVFSPAVFSPAVFSPAVFSPAVFSAENYASAQARSIAGVSANGGTADEAVVANTWNETEWFYVRVTGRNGAFDAERAFSLSVTVDGVDCAGVAPIAPTTPITAPAGDYESIVVWDPGLMDAGVDGNDAASMAALDANLDALASRGEVRGAVVDLGDYSHIQELHEQADTADACPYAENLTASAIKQIVDTYRAANPDLRYVVLAGSDAQIPFFRYPDQALIGPEQNYDPPVANGTQSQSSLRLNYILGQDEYGATTTLSLREGDLPVPDLAVGRLVESADDMNAVLDAYLSTSDGVVATPSSTLVTGYDFLADSANAVASEIAAGTGVGATNSTLITAADISPDDPRSWTADDLRRELLVQGDDIVFLAGHFSANSALAADYSTSIVTTELAGSAVDLTNSLIFSGGCHSGYNIVDGDVVPGVTLPLDWAEAFAAKGATLVAGTGYQYGDTDFLEYSERLYALFARELRRGTGAVSVGEALARAKQQYLASTPELRPLHYKSVLISTVFGLPMLSIDMPGERIVDEPTTSTIVPTAVASGTPGSQLGLQTVDIDVTDALVPRTVRLTNLEGGTLDATYLEGPDGVVTNPAEPAIPLVSRDVSVPGQSLRGVGFRGGSWSEQSVVPLTGAPTTELRGVHTPFVSTVNFPMRLAKVNYLGAISGAGGTVLNVTPAQHRVATVGDTQATLRSFDSLDYRLYYSNDTRTYGANRPALSGPPTFANVRAEIDGDDVVFRANVVGDPSAGMQEVWVTYTDGAGTSGTWVSLDLVQDVDDSTLWTGRLVGAALAGAFGRLEYVLQATNGVGLVTLDDNYGAYYRVLTGAVNPDGTPADPLATSELAISAPGVTTYGADLTVSATLTSVGAPVAGAPVVFSMGGTGRVATTGADGVATVTLPVTATPGSYTVYAAFGSTPSLAGSGAGASVDVGKAATSLTAAVVGGDVTATLVDAAGTPLLDRTVYFTRTGPGGTTTIASLTDNVGVARIGSTGLADGSYTVTARFLGPIPTAEGTEVKDDDVYLPSSATVALNVDRTGPTITFVGATAYELDQTVLITCTAADPSGVASTSCPNVASGPASSFPVGTTTRTATATDVLGNSSSASVAFTVRVSSGGLCSLTRQQVTASAKYRSLNTRSKATIDALVTSGCNALQAITPTTPRLTARAYVVVYKAVVATLRAGSFLTATQATALAAHADRLVPA